ncbi:MAG: hypothetical protein WDA72_06170 [Desulfomonilia bacterium]|jgi:hypothetical protein|nr:hypothetical protein [Deltaproteobacteria bacterium]MDX9762271.1 hypothetical protein [Desulfomonilia bacterium]
MKRVFGLLVFGILVVSSVCYAADAELRLRPYYLIPGQDDYWDYALGIDARYVFWTNPNMGIALSGGLATWEANDGIFFQDDLAAQLDGSALVIPLGVSVLLRPMPAGAPFDLILEGGLRYVVVDSKVDLAATDFYYYFKDELDIENSVVGILGAEVGFPLSDGMGLSFGLGYQFDISKGDVEWFGVNIEEFEMKGFYFNFGVNISL